jgi:transposase
MWQPSGNVIFYWGGFSDLIKLGSDPDFSGIEAISRVQADPHKAVPELIRGTARLLIEEIRLLEARIVQLERELAALAKLSPACTTLLSIPGIGLLTATAPVAATSGDVSHFKDARHFASWFGLTPKEYSSGSSRYLGRISHRGDRYFRMRADARRPQRAARVQGGGQRWARGLWCSALGTGCTSQKQPQQGGLRAGQ